MDVIWKCEQIQGTSYLQNIPVHSRSSDVVYANLFCAICHEDLNLTNPKAEIKCNNEDLLANCGISPMQHILLPKYHHSNSLKWTRLLGQFGIDPLNNCSESQSYSLQCSLELQLKNKPKTTRPCHHANMEVIDYCPYQENHFCRLYQLIVSYQGRYYSNPHCAQCHGLALNATQCAKSRGK